MSVGVFWVAPPSSTIIPGIVGYEERITQGIHMLADLFAAKMQGEAQANAPWNDVTGAARQGLLGVAHKAATEIVIYLFHSVHYGPYLEFGTSKMAPRPIILPTLQANYPQVMEYIMRLLSGL